MNLPTGIDCYINSPNNGVYSSNLISNLFVTDSDGPIEVDSHNGSCQVKTTLGDIKIKIALGQNGFCHGFTSEGNITLKIPAASSATIYAKPVRVQLITVI